MKIRYFLLCLIIVIIVSMFLEKSNTKEWIWKKNRNNTLLNSQILANDKKNSQKNDYIYDGQELNLKSKAACVYDCKSERLLYGKNAGEKLPMASTTKIMTCIIALEYANLEDIYVVSRYAASMPDVQLNAVKGDSFVLKDLLYSLMLESHNDVAVVIAENIGASVLGSKVNIDSVDESKKYVAAFASLMNKKVKELGLSNTNFVTPNGLDADKHYTTAYELACIASYAIKNKTFLDIIGANNYTFTSKSGRSYIVNNRNQFLHQYSGAIGCKTGYTSKAGYCFVGAIDREEHDLVSVVLGCGWPPNKTYKWQDTRKLMDYGVNNFNSTEVVIDGKVFNNKKIVVENGYSKEYLQPNIDLKFNILLREDEKVKVKIKMINKLVAPIKKNQVVGFASVFIGNNEYKRIEIKADKTIKRITYKDKFTELLHFFLGNTIDINCN